MQLTPSNISKIKNIALDAGKAILEVYNSPDFEVEIKDDNSPLTIADKRSNEIIVAGLKKHYPEIPILSEEGRDIPYDERKNWDYFWLVDPLDGTKEFIKKNGEFTVNIALMKANKPIFGIIHTPVLGFSYWNEPGKGAFKEDHNWKEVSKLPSSPLPEKITSVGSRSHSSEEEATLLQKLDVEESTSIGSSLKFCLLAEGKAHYYLRFGPTMEWDTAAGQAIAEGVGAKMTTIEDKPFLYNKANLLNPGFIVKNRFSR